MNKNSKNLKSGMAFSKNKCILLYKRNAVAECIRSKKVKALYFDEAHKNDPLMAEAAARGINYITLDKKGLAEIVGHQPHQGVVALCDPIPLLSIDRLIEESNKDEHPLILICDGIEDPHNMGAILRSCDAFHISGIIFKNASSVSINSTVCNVSTGACFYVRVCCVSNLSNAIAKLKENGFWIASSDGSADMSYKDLDYGSKLGIVVGSEGFGISRLVLKNSDFVVKIPMEGHVNSLNASVATGILLSYARSKQW